MQKAHQKLAWLLTVCAVVMAAGGTARADVKGNKILKMYETRFNAFEDQWGKYKFIIRNKGGNKVVRFTLYNLPGWKRVLKFTHPANVRGQTFLILSEDEMYVYLPAYKRVRRVAGHVRNQSFMGSDFMFDDMNIGYWSHDYDATLTKEDGKAWYLSLKKKRGRSPVFPRLKIKIIKRIRQAAWIKFLSNTGRLLRTQTFYNWTCQSGVMQCSPSRIRITDHRRNNHKTDLDTVECRYNVGISKRKFTLRYLARGS